MRRFLFSIALSLFSIITVWSSPLSWDKASDYLFTVVEESVPEMNNALRSSGLGSGVDFGYVSKTKTLQYVVHLNDPDMIRALTDKDMESRRDGMIEEIIMGIYEYEEGDELMKETIEAMIREDGKFNLIYTAQDGEEKVKKNIYLTPADFKRIEKILFEDLFQSYPSPYGHTYVAKANGMTIKYVFKSPSSVDGYFSDGYYESVINYTWYQDGKYIVISDEGSPLEISTDGKTLKDTYENVTFRMKK